MTRLERMLAGSPYAGYAYAYPHKSAYGRLAPEIRLRDVWQEEPRHARFLYVHVPFCEMRCGFCNLFTTANPPDSLVSSYLDALCREADVVRNELGDMTIARCAIGGGTPTHLTPHELGALFDQLQSHFGMRSGEIPISVETSPQTATGDRLRLLRDRGVTRISIGVQSFDEMETAAAGRAPPAARLDGALSRLRDCGIPCVNLDLIYGLPRQTIASWERSLQRVLSYAPEELYLYPLYVRPLTGLDRAGPGAWDDFRLDCYRLGRELLVARGYEQVSMRMFRRRDIPSISRAGIEYCCQDDGMIGLGCGARSYTRALHYSSEFAVRRPSVRRILDTYVRRSPHEFAAAAHGAHLDPNEQRRRYVIKSLLRVEGLSCATYRDRFGSEVLDDLPELRELFDHQLAVTAEERVALTPGGLERSDTLGPWPYSEAVRRRSELAVLQ